MLIFELIVLFTWLGVAWLIGDDPRDTNTPSISVLESLIWPVWVSCVLVIFVIMFFAIIPIAILTRIGTKDNGKY